MNSLVYYSFLYGLISVLVKTISFFTFLVLGKIFTPNEYAVFGLLYSIHQGVATFSIAGINESVVGFLKDIKSIKDKEILFSNVLIVTIQLSVIIYMLLTAFYIFYFQNNNPSISPRSFYFTICSGILLSFSIFLSQMNRLKENHYGSILYLSVPQILLFFGGILSIYVSNNLQNFFIGSFFLLLIFLVLFRFLYRKGNFLLKYGNYTKKIIFNSFPYFLIAVFGWLGGYGTNFIINIYFDYFEVAAFTFIYTISGVMLMISNSLNQVWSPRFYNTFSTESFAQIETKNNFFYGSLAIVLGIATSIIIIIYPFLLKNIGGNLLLYLDMKLELYLILLSYIIYTPIWHYRLYYYANSSGLSLMRISILSSLIGICFMIIFINILDKIGIYIGFLSMTFINLLLISIISSKKWKLSINWINVFIGFIISFITFYLTYYDYNVLYSIVFLVVVVLIYIFYLRKIMKKINL